MAFIRRHGEPLREEQGSGSGGGVDRSQQFREIHINQAQIHKFASNEVMTGKYTFLTFLPKFLFEQFRRYANVFFLAIGLLQQIPEVSPTGRYVTIVPFSVILGLTAVKEIIEDYKRHRDDSKVNNTIAEVFSLEQCKYENKLWKQITVGDIVRVRSDKPFPADLLLLSSSEPNGMCFIETANLDGETNLKIRTAVQDTVEKFEDENSIGRQRGVIHCELPNRLLYEFKGNIQLNGDEKIPLSEDAILLRGSKLKNSAYIHGIVIYSGPETKFMMNSTKAPLKRSHMDITTNYQILYLFLILILMSLLSAVGNEIVMNNGQYHYYVDSTRSNFFYNLLTFVILYNNLIPISLLVTLEFVKFFQAYFVNWDKEMYYEPTDTYALARTSNLNEELGQIRYVFSDKTGTLTQNVMEFRSASIAGGEYYVTEREKLKRDIETDLARSAVIHEFLLHLSVCHTVIPEIDAETGAISYNASSPDEEALVKGAAAFGYSFENRTQTDVFVQIAGESEPRRFEIKEIIAFTSKRKRMSVIVEEKSSTGDRPGRLKLYIKGADNIILSRLDSRSKDEPYFEETLGHVQAFAERGLRTLCFAVREISDEFFESWQEEYTNAKSDPTSDRDDLMEAAADKIERELKLIGATGIEDKLQDGVPETIADLLSANINVWMLTGDKQETAINIGRSCNLLKTGNRLIVIDTESLDNTREVINENMSYIKGQNNNSGMLPANELVVDGDSLVFALDHSLRHDFIELCCQCSSVICCRVSPMQKADMVELVQKHTKDICLSIGDGANDVAMIQKANVGVGISGNEGLQAANSSDFAIGQFRFLSRLLFVHGAWFNLRNSKVILYSFYKNICLYIIELWFAFSNNWTGQVLFERWTIGMYNMLFTSAPPIAIGLFDQSCTAQTRMTTPTLYKGSQSSQFFNLKVFWFWIGNAVVHSAILYLIPMFSYDGGVVWSSGRNGEYLVLGNIVYTCVVITVCIKAGMTLDAWNWICHLAIWGSIAVWLLFLCFYSYVWPMGIKLAPNMAGMIELLFTTSNFWLGILIVPILSLVPDVSYLAFKTTVKPTHTDAVRMAEKVRASQVPSEGSSLLGAATLRTIFRKKANSRGSAQPDMELRNSGYAFSQEESGAQEKVAHAYDTTKQKRFKSSGNASRDLSASSKGLPGTVTF